MFFLAFYVFIKHVFSRQLGTEDLAYIKAHWEDVLKLSEEDPVMAIMNADKILNYTLSRYGFEGSLGEKLKAAAPRFSRIDHVWAAHKLRNTLAHEFIILEREQVRITLKRFERALKDLGAKL
jgi:hypothetical protein